jgi:glycosyltransferase involved in cell wall biosynthesis
MPSHPPSVLILIGGHLSSAPRPQKEARALRAAGFDVQVLGVWVDPMLAAEDEQIAASIGVRFRPIVDLTPCASGRFRKRLLHRLAHDLYAKLGVLTPRVFGRGAPEFFRAARKSSAGIVIGHSEAALWVCESLLTSGHKVGFDFEDWFSEDLLPRDRVARPTAQLASLEKRLLSRAAFSLATTSAMAEALVDFSGTKRLPTVIPNCFPAGDIEAAAAGSRDVRNLEGVSFHWFSQTLGPGRGLEAVARAVLTLNGKWQLMLRGRPGVHGRWAEDVFGSMPRDRVVFLDAVPNAELLGRTMSHDVGLALESPFCKSRDLTATNKIFEYMRAGLAVIATNTRGQTEVLDRCPEAGVLVAPDDAVALATAMQRFIDDSEALGRAKRASREAARSIWNWELFEPRLVRTVQHALEQESA